MSDRSLIFPTSEYRARVERLQARMAAAGQDALLLTSPADVFYVTGFLTRFWESPARPWFIVVPAQGDPIAVIPAIGADLMRRTWINDIRTWAAPDPVDDGVSLLADTLCDLVSEGGVIATPMGLETSARLPLGDFMRIADRIASRRFVDGTDTIQRVREVKSEAEIAKIRTICGVADRAFARVPDFAGVGRPLDEVFRDFQKVLLDEGADWVSYTAGGAGQGGYGDVISPAGPEPLRAGDILMLDTGAVKDGYFCDFDRNYAVGAPSDDVKRAQAALTHSIDVALDILRPGMLARDVHRILTDAIVAKGAVAGGGRLGHGLGITLTEWPSFTPLDTTELRAGMVLTLEPGVEIAPNRILVHEENIVLREEGPVLLSTRAPEFLPEV
ncbi:Xaa-Pro peptidase family protein [Marivivens sp. JLT3646]|uniref:M24 family metallopeptidase n=1 Tax=Marivivens sp. JLT3646 TaxID=1920883 RepID=UPI0007FE90C9|nr:Xaa-Pro peptidase family protein [Marivivens sp. JLT3646]APO87166.1 peptidase M24 [Marivivens sp. JLT3646]OBR39889.1 peptidase M24 [Donghicola sp. JL3646]